MAVWVPGPGLAAYHAGVTVVCQLAAQFTDETWSAPTPCPEMAGRRPGAHLRCVADDYHEYLDDAPVSRLARLMAGGDVPERPARKLARQDAAELTALPDATGPEHIAAFAVSARAYAARVGPAWDLPHHRYRDTVVTVGGMFGAACAEWHLHAWDLARSLGKDYRPADRPAGGWLAGRLPHLPLAEPLAALHTVTCGAGPGAGSGWPARPAAANGAAGDPGGAKLALLCASGRLA